MVRTAALLTSILVRPARRSVEHSVEKRRPVGDESPDRMPGAVTCDGPRTRSIFPESYHWPKASNSPCDARRLHGPGVGTPQSGVAVAVWPGVPSPDLFGGATALLMLSSLLHFGA